MTDCAIAWISSNLVIPSVYALGRVVLVEMAKAIDHPVLKHLLTINQNMSECIAVISDSSGSCPGFTVQMRKCRGSSHSAARAKAFLDEVYEMEKWPDADNFVDRIEGLLRDACCHHHVHKVIENDFASWKATTLPTIISSSSESENPTVIEANVHEIHLTITNEVRASIESRHSESLAEAVSIEPVVRQLSGLSVSTTTDPLKPLNMAAVKISGLGMAGLVRKGSIRDGSAIFREMHVPLTPRQQKEGIVYILRDKASNGCLFKIGYTRMTAAARLRQTGNCLKSNTDVEIIYESPAGPFFAAHKAEQLAQTVLKNHKLLVRQCDQCGGGHKEWFQATEAVVLGAVQSMERFVRYPAYEETPDGQWKLSDAGYKVIRGMCNLKLDVLDAALTKHTSRVVVQEEEIVLDRENDAGDISAVSELEQAGGMEPRHDQSSLREVRRTIEGEQLTVETGSPPGRQPQRRSRRSLGTSAAVIGKTVVSAANSVRSHGSSALRRWRGMTPETVGAPAAKTAVGEARGGKARDSANGMGDLIADVFWSLVPGELRSASSDSHNMPVVQSGGSWTWRMKQSFRAQYEDYEREWNRTDELKGPATVTC